MNDKSDPDFKARRKKLLAAIKAGEARELERHAAVVEASATSASPGSRRKADPKENASPAESEPLVDAPPNEARPSERKPGGPTLALAAEVKAEDGFSKSWWELSERLQDVMESRWRCTRMEDSVPLAVAIVGIVEQGPSVHGNWQYRRQDAIDPPEGTWVNVPVATLLIRR